MSDVDVLTRPISINGADMHKGSKFCSNLSEPRAITMGYSLCGFVTLNTKSSITKVHLHTGCGEF